MALAGCQSIDSSQVRVKGETPKPKPKTKSFDINAVCPDGPTEKCYSQHLYQIKEGNFERIEPVMSALCRAESLDKKILVYRQAVCFWEAKLLAARGNYGEAKSLREEACKLDVKFCIDRQANSYSADFFEILDLAPRFCVPGTVRPGALTKSFLDRLCILKVDHSDSQKLAQAWILAQEKSLEPWLLEVKKIQSSNREKKVDLDFAAAPENVLRDFYLSLKTRKLPVKVSFELYSLSPIARPMDYFPGGVQVDAGGEQARLPQIPLTGFSGTTKQGWTSGFSGYAGLMPKELFDLSRRLQVHGSSGFKIKVTATVIGYRETGVIPVPVIVLDPETK